MAANARRSSGELLGIDYSGAGPYSPPLWTAVLAGLILGALIASALHRSAKATGKAHET